MGVTGDRMGYMAREGERGDSLFFIDAVYTL